MDLQPTGETIIIGNAPNPFPPAPEGWTGVTLYEIKGEYFAAGGCFRNNTLWINCIAKWHNDHWDTMGQDCAGNTFVTGHFVTSTT